MQKAYSFVVFFCLILIGWAHPVAAHPHITATYTVSVGCDDHGLTELTFIFKLDGLPNPIVSLNTYVMGDEKRTERTTFLDTDRLLLAELGKNPFYLYMTLEGDDQLPKPVQLEPAGQIEGKPVYRFHVLLDKERHDISFSLYDPTYYVLVQQDKEKSVMTTSDPMTCKTETYEAGQTVWGPLIAQRVTCEVEDP